MFGVLCCYCNEVMNGGCNDGHKKDCRYVAWTIKYCGDDKTDLLLENKQTEINEKNMITSEQAKNYVTAWTLPQEWLTIALIKIDELIKVQLNYDLSNKPL